MEERLVLPAGRGGDANVSSALCCSPQQRPKDTKSQHLRQREKDRRQKETKKQLQRQQENVWSESLALAVTAAESFILPVGASLIPGDPATPVLSMGCTSLLSQTPQSLDDAIDALVLQHRLSPDDCGYVKPPLKFSYVGAGLLQPCWLRQRHPVAGRSTASADYRKEIETGQDLGAAGIGEVGEGAEKTGVAPRTVGTGGGRRNSSTQEPNERKKKEGGALDTNEVETVGSYISSLCSGGRRNTPAYDWLYALGCLNCGKPLTLAADLLPSAEAATAGWLPPAGSSGSNSRSRAGSREVKGYYNILEGEKVASSDDDSLSRAEIIEDRPALICSNCGHHVCPLHEANEAETLADAGLLPGHNSSARRNGEGPSHECKRGFGVSDGVYLFGKRQQYVTSEWEKRFWQERFLGDSFEQQRLQQRLRLVEAVGKEKQKGVVCKDTCENCGNREAFYSSFQARSADEGMTVMYECTRCGRRKVINT